MMGHGVKQAMFGSLFQVPYYIRAQQNAPLAQERELFLRQLENQGYDSSVLQRIAKALLLVVSKIKFGPSLGLTPETIQQASDSRRPNSQCLRRDHPHMRHQLSIDVARRWLQFLGYPCQPIRASTPYASMIADFAKWMEDERGLSPATIKMWCDRVARFLEWYYTLGRPFEAVNVSDIDSYLMAYCKRTSRISTVAFGSALRAFFKHAEMRGWCPRGIGKVIYLPRVFSHETIPAGPSWEDVSRLLADANGNSPMDIRDRAIMLLFSVYGFRAGEVSKLRVDDVDWERKCITVPRSKSRRTQIYPLSLVVGSAIIKYLKEGRRRCAYREIFLSLQAPIKPMGRSGLSAMVWRRMSKLEISAAHHGAHALRHSCAARLMAEGFSYKEIADHLGHESLFSTQIYSKVDVPHLREVGDFDLGGLI